MKKDVLNEAMLALSFFGKISPQRFQKIIKDFPEISQSGEISLYKLLKSGVKEKIAYEFIKFNRNFKSSEIINYLQKEKIYFTHLFSEDYPPILKEISDPPIVLYYKGKINPWPENTLAIVGARKNTYYGEKVIRELLKSFSFSDLTIISGMALGTDSLAHKESLENNIKTFAVLGSGLDEKSLYPPENLFLAEKIISSGGAIISEFPPGTKPEKYNFPRRNRIIAGFSKAVLVVEAEEKSGSLITARCALEENRDVLAIPGSIFSNLSRGTNFLIASGAKLIKDSSDILDYFPKIKKIDVVVNKEEVVDNNYGLNDNEKLLYYLIKKASEEGSSLSFDELMLLSKLDSALINSTLSILEIAGMIKKDGPAHSIT